MLLFFFLGSTGHLDPDLKQGIVSSSPHYGHSGIVEAARNLFRQIEGNDEDDGKYVYFLPTDIVNACITVSISRKNFQVLII